MQDPAQASRHDAAELQAIDRALARASFSIDGLMLRPNANFLQLFGYRARELIGKPHAVLAPPGDAGARDEAELWVALRRSETRRRTYDRLRQDGTPIRVRSTYAPVCDADGEVVEVVCIATDVTLEARRIDDDRGQIVSIDASQPVAHFALDGTLLHANAHFLCVMGYSLDEVRGAHHRIFVEAAEAEGPAYCDFWDALRSGRHQTGVYRRLGHGGRTVWLHASYQPIPGPDGRPCKVVAYALDVTRDRTDRLDHEAQIAAVHKSHCVISFDMDGTVLDANPLFLDAVGYRLDEVAGRHHRMFVDPSYAHGPEYAAFWSRLAEGRPQVGEYRRFGKHGREVWLQASYNPIQDVHGRLHKVVKYATVITREKLRQADHQGQIASIHKAQCVVTFDLDGGILDANDNFLDATGYRLSEIRGRHHRMFVDPATADSADYLAFWSDLARGRYRAAEFKRLCKDGREIWLQASYNPIFDMNGRPFKVVKYATNITQERLRQADNEGQIAAIRKSQAVVAFDMEGRVLDANDNFLEAMGYALREIVGRHHGMFVDPAVAESEDYRIFWDDLNAGRFRSDKYRRVGKDGRQVWMHASYNPIFDLSGRPFKVIKIATDVTASVELATQVVVARQEAEHDLATGLPNRLGLTVYLKETLARVSPRLAVLYLDLDHFKPINDTFGHAVGDRVLKETASRLRDALKPGQIAARIGGDEFVVAAPDLTDEQVDALCRRLVEVVKMPIRYDSNALAVGLSIGVAVSPGDATTPDDLLRCADVALYRTKGNGRDGYSFFAPAMHERLSANRHLAEELLHGIKAGQFHLDFEPRFELGTRSLRDALALVRWDHPEPNRVAEVDFIDLAERSGLIVPLVDWALHAACLAAQAWPEAGVIVPISAVHFAAADVPALVASVLQASGLAAQRLTLQLTERVLADDPQRALDGLRTLSALGVRLVLEGHGLHHASLAAIRAYPFDEVVIDPRFVVDLELEHDGARIVRDIRQASAALTAVSTVAGLGTNGHTVLLSLDDAAQVRGCWRGVALAVQEMTALSLRSTAPLEIGIAA